MSRLGTCRHAFQTQEAYVMAEQTVRIDQPEDYTCQWLDTAGLLPPPINRMHGGFSIRESDCDACPRYEAVPIAIPGVKQEGCT